MLNDECVWSEDDIKLGLPPSNIIEEKIIFSTGGIEFGNKEIEHRFLVVDGVVVKRTKVLSEKHPNINIDVGGANGVCAFVKETVQSARDARSMYKHGTQQTLYIYSK